MKTKILMTVAVAIAMLGATVFAQQPSEMDRHHREMMPLHVKLLEQQKAQDSEIDRLLTEMNGATGEKRIDAIIAVVNKLVEQRKATNAEIAAHLDK